MTPPLRVLVVAHTHWDREWYHTASRFRQRLVELIDELLDEPPPPGASFLLDGQAIVLDDYLAVRPERAADLASLLRESRLEAGPWYVLPDELIPSGEALVRNLLAGGDVLRRMRAQPPPVLYCPDAFGHPAVLPDLAAGFGCEVVIVWRGYGGARWPAGDTVRWRGAAGSEVLLSHLSPDGYETGSSLPHPPDEARDRWRRLSAVLAPRATLGITLLLNGADHHARQREWSLAMRSLADAATPAIVESVTLRAAAGAIADAARTATLPVVEGELRDSYGYTWTLQGTLASRASQKRRNAQLERLLVRDVEPWIALGGDAGRSATRALLRTAWRALLECHPHDTLCGTSIDPVATALDARQADVAEQGRGLRESALANLIAHDVEQARHAQASWRPVVVLRNPAARPRGGVVELTLSATIADVAVGPGSASRQGARRPLPPWRVDGMMVQPLNKRERVALTESPRDYPDADLIAEVRAVGWVGAVGGYALETRSQGAPARAGRREDVLNPVQVESRALDNGLLRVEISERGDVRVYDRATGRMVERALVLEDAEDVGDLYTPAIRRSLPAPVLRRHRVVHRGPLRGAIALDFRMHSARRSERGGACTLSLELDANAPFLRIRIAGQNATTDHRLRLRIATGLARSSTLADAPFHPIVREPLVISDGDAEMEQVVQTAPLHRWVTRFGANAGATIVSDGLAEYESLEDGAVAITLVRSVGALSRHDLPERPGHAGWPADTPLAQCLGDYSAVVALALHGANSPAQRDLIERLADDVLLPLVGETLRSNLGAPRALRGLELSGEGLAFSAAMPAREAGWMVLRCVNRTDSRVDGVWRIGHAIAEARLARLDETPLAPLAPRDGVIAFVAEPLAIVTILARRTGND